MREAAPSPGELRPVIRFWGTVALVLGTTIGSGIFRKPGPIAADLQSPLLILGLWAFFGLVMLSGALTLAELAALLPRTGGLYVYLRAAYGDAAAFTFGWLYLLVTVPAAMGALALFFGEVLAGLLGSPPGAASSFALAMLALFAWTNVRGVREGDALQRGLAALKVVALLGILIAAFAHSSGTFSHLAPSAAAARAGAVGSSLSSLLWCYSGWQAATMVAGESCLSPRRMAWGIVLGVLLVMVLYVGVNLAYFYALPADEIAGERIVAGSVLRLALGPWGETVAAVSILTSVLGALNGQFMAKTRVAYALARDGLGFRFLGRSHRTHGTPVASILVSTGVAAVLVLSLKTFDALTAYFAPVEWTALLFAVGAVRGAPAVPGAWLSLDPAVLRPLDGPHACRSRRGRSDASTLCSADRPCDRRSRISDPRPVEKAFDPADGGFQ